METRKEKNNNEKQTTEQLHPSLLCCLLFFMQGLELRALLKADKKTRNFNIDADAFGLRRRQPLLLDGGRKCLDLGRVEHHAHGSSDGLGLRQRKERGGEGRAVCDGRVVTKGGARKSGAFVDDFLKITFFLGFKNVLMRYGLFSGGFAISSQKRAFALSGAHL